MIDWDDKVIAPNMAVFGEDVKVSYRPKVGTAFDVDAVFDRAFFEVTLNDEGVPINTTRPVVGVRTAQFAADPRQGDRLYIPRTRATYVVNNFEPDGHGWALLRLNLVSPAP